MEASDEIYNDRLSGEGAKKCPNCGGVVSYDIKSRSFKCLSCGTVCEINPPKGSVDEYSINDYRVRERSSAALTGVAYAKCDSCGGEIYFDANETAKRCPMCGSAHIRAEVAQSGIAPEGIVPFRIDSDDAQQRFHKWVNKRWFAPNLLKKAYGEGALEGLFVPFWTYDADAMAEYSGQGGRTRIVRDRKGNTRTYTDWYPVSGRVYNTFNDVLVCASKKASGTLIESVGPFNTVSDIVPFTPEYLTGYLAERYSIDGISSFAAARASMESTLRSQCHSDIITKGFNTATVSRFTPKYKDVTYKSVLLPLYSASYGYQGKTYSYAINGQTGRVTGSYPKSALKITLAVIAAIIVLLGLYWLFGTYSESSSGGYYYDGGSSFFDADYEYADDYDSWFSPSNDGGSYYGAGDYYEGGSQWYDSGSGYDSGYYGYDDSSGYSDGYYDYDSDPYGYLDEYRADGAQPPTEEEESEKQAESGAQESDAA